MKLVVSLGNPGKQYEKTRHNVGFMVMDAVAKKLHLPEWTSAPKNIQAKVTDMLIEGQKIIFAKPETFMNNSGFPVAALADYFSIAHADVLVIHDDLDIPLGDIKLQQARGAAGHNGVLSIMEQLGGKDFTRIRVGVAPAKKPADGAKFVLGRFGLLEKRTLTKGIIAAVTSLEEWLTNA